MYKNILGTFSIFVSGADLERFMSGGVDIFFGSKWPLLIYFFALLIGGTRLIFARQQT